MPPKVGIALATFNGVAYIKEQIESIICQLEPDIDVVIYLNDDRSSDSTIVKTIELLQKFNMQFFASVSIENMGYSQNFCFILEQIYADKCEYFFLCDQDDIWERGKLRCMTKALVRSSDAPTLAYSHGLVFGYREERKKPRYVPEFFPNFKCRKRFLLVNSVPGCLMAGNLSLLKIAVSKPKDVIHHDWWLLLSALYMGDVVEVREQLVRYRRHESNQIGLWRLSYSWSGFRELCGKVRKHFRLRLIKVSELKSLEGVLGGQRSRDLEKLQTILASTSYFSRLFKIYRSGYLPNGIKSKIVVLIQML